MKVGAIVVYFGHGRRTGLRVGLVRTLRKYDATVQDIDPSTDGKTASARYRGAKHRVRLDRITGMQYRGRVRSVSG